MNKPKTVLLLNGSPKCERSNSRQIGKFLVDKLQEKGLTSEEAFAARLIKTPEGCEQLLKSVDQADIIVLATPLYVDSIPSFTIKALETINDHRKTVHRTGTQLLVGVMNSGFPEKEHMDIALKILQNFAKESGLQWAGAVSVGMGGALNGKPLKEGKGMTANLTRGLSLASVALVEGEAIPSGVEDLTSKPFMPIFLTKIGLRLLGKRMWNGQAKDNCAKREMYATPYKTPE